MLNNYHEKGCENRGVSDAHEAEYVEGILPLTIPDINRDLSA